MLGDIEKVLLSEDELKDTVKKLGARISRDYNGKNLLILSILKGSVVFTADLMREITIPCKIDFMAVSSYGEKTESSGKIKIIKDVKKKTIRGADVLIVEDILDTGNTLNSLVKILSERGPASIKICALLDKPSRRQVNLTADYSGVSIPDAFVVGYGLDFNEKYRNLPFVGILKPEIYE